MRRSLLAVLLVISLWALAREINLPRAYHAKTYPAREEHPTEHITIAADPYDLPDKANAFHTDFLKRGLMPVHLILSNDGDTPIALTDMKIELLTADKGWKIGAANQEAVYRRLVKQKKRGDEPKRIPIPVPMPRPSKPDVGISQDTRDELDAMMFRAKAVEPHGTQAGFLFFDVEGIRNPLAGAKLYITGLRDGNGQELLYFEIPMEKYLTYKPQ